VADFSSLLFMGGWLAVTGLGTLAASMYDRKVRRARVELWMAVAEGLGLTWIDGAAPLVGKARLEAKAGRTKVSFERYKANKVALTTVAVQGNSGISLLREELATPALKKRELELGDETFDAAVNIHGGPERVRAILDAETRRIAMRMLNGLLDVEGERPVWTRAAMSLSEGELRAVFDERPEPPTQDELAETLAAMLSLVKRFQRPADLAARLSATVENEPLWRVRLRGLELLSVSYPKHPATLGALRHALADEHPEVRLHAAMFLGEEGTPTLLALASALDEDTTSAQAIAALGGRFAADAAESVLRQALRLRRLQSAEACIHALGRTGGDGAGGLLAKVLAIESGALAQAAARALGSRGGAEAERALLAALESGAPDLALPVVEALGRVGSARAVPPIQDAAAGPGSSGDLRRAARQAVAEIQSRLSGASPGQLTLADGEAGQLSLADDDPRGRVSLPAPR
jgi:HEAT repeat protein